MRSSSLPRVAPLLFCSGACALVYQVAWFRELRLIFGASTAASAATLAVFMAGLGVGGRVLGRRVDNADNPLAYYATLETGVAISAAITPLLVMLAQSVYLGIGGAASLGSTGATLARMVLTLLVLGVPVFLMGGTLPAAARSIERSDDEGRQRVATLYGVNTVGAVVGTLATNFVLLEVFGTRFTLWLGCLINLLVAVLARGIARRPSPPVTAGEAAKDEEAAPAGSLDAGLRWFPPFAAGVAGLAFMLMELVWYRMLAPLLGGSSYTFGLILAIALIGIGVGGLAYARTKRPATLSLFAATCALEAFMILVPYALGDRIAELALLLRPLVRASFGSGVLAWAIVASIVVLPAAIVSGYQFPLVIGLYGRGAKNIAKDIGNAYLANTIGSIIGSIGGGFGLLPLLTAPRCWQLVGALLLATAILSAVLDLKLRRAPAALISFVVALPTAFLLTAVGPTAFWRHFGIGAGRADLGNDVTKLRLERDAAAVRSQIIWEEDGLESSIALRQQNAFVFMVNGKADGHIIIDSGTQVMGGLLPALLHGHTKRALVVGLGTGSTAGWLGLVPNIDRVDVVELEPSILRVAKDCGPANGHVMDNPKVKITLGDAREVLRTTKEKYDLIFSEPSNPYRAGISSLYTEEFYRATATRLADDGLFVQWLQAYEVDPTAIATAAVTLRQVYPQIAMWQTAHGDLLLIASRSRAPIDVNGIRERIKTEPYATAARAVWRTSSAEGVLAHFVAQPAFVDMLAEQRLGPINTDDQNFLEFSFARNVGKPRDTENEVRQLATRLGFGRPPTIGEVDGLLYEEERMLMQVHHHQPVDVPATPNGRAFGTMLLQIGRDEFTPALATWTTLGRPPRSHHEALLIANAAARTGDERAESIIATSAFTAVDQALLRGLAFVKKHDFPRAAELFEKGFVAARSEPWFDIRTMQVALATATQLGEKDPATAKRFAVTLSEPFSVGGANFERVNALTKLAPISADPALCVRTIDGLGRLPFDAALYEARVNCYKQAHDPRLADAEVEYGRLAMYTLPFGSDIPSPPKPARPTPAPPSASDVPPFVFGADGGIVDADAP